MEAFSYGYIEIDNDIILYQIIVLMVKAGFDGYQIIIVIDILRKKLFGIHIIEEQNLLITNTLKQGMRGLLIISMLDVNNQ